ncbi:MAG: 4-hydroxybutyrate CoA-transferase [Chloroflexi bacterium]|nr:4-hydroxybutyrate CoA-transferase [Chloroflexota bacterium]
MERRSAREAIAALPATGRVFLGSGCGTPTSLCDALATERERFSGLTIYSGLLFDPQPFFDAVPTHFTFVSLHPTAPVEALISQGRADYLPLRYSRIPDSFAPNGPLPVDAALIQVSSPDGRGYCSLGAAVSTALPILRSAPLVIAEVNPACPRTHGDGFVHVSEIDIGVDAGQPLAELKPARVGEVERAIAGHVAELVPDGATIQIGIGSVPQAILDALKGHRDLGVHSGMLCDGMVPLIEAGVITGARKSVDRRKHAAGEILGTRSLFAFVNDNPSIRMLPASLSHGLDYLRHHERFIAINSALEVDLTGQVNAEWLAGRQVSGLGGQFDFVEATMHIPGARSILALASTAAGGKVSRITPALAAGAAVTTPRYCADVVVTELGVADLRAKTLRQRAEALTAVAHPDFRAGLDTALRSAGVAGR